MGMINYGSNGVASCEVAEVWGLPALGRYALRFRLKMSIFDFRKHNANPGYFVSFDGELETPAGLTHLHPVHELVGLVEQDREIYIDAHLDHEQMRLLDEVRRHRQEDLTLVVHLRPLISVDRVGVQPTHAALRCGLNDSHWIKILAGAGFDERDAIDLLITFPGQPENLAKAALEFQHAKACDRKRDWAGTLTRCRCALDEADVPTQLKALTRDLGLAERVQGLYAAVRHTLHAGPHRDIGDPGPHDARRALCWTSLILDDLNRLARNATR